MATQTSFLTQVPVAERLFVGFERGRQIFIEHFPAGCLPERLEAMELSDKEAHYILWAGDEGMPISAQSYLRIKSACQRIQSAWNAEPTSKSEADAWTAA